MSTAIANTRNTLGVRTLGAVERRRTAEMSLGAERRRTAELFGVPAERRRTIVGLGSAPDPDTLNALAAAGYDSGTLQALVAMGASDEQLLALPYPADPGEMADAVTTLMNQLGHALPPAGGNATQAGSYPPSAVPTTISTAWGTYDLVTRGAWDAIAGLFSTVQQSVQQAGAKNPKDPVVFAKVSQFNELVAQFADYYQRAVGSNLSNIPFASVTLSGIGDSNVAQWLGPLLGPVGDILNALSSIWNWAKNYIASNQATAATTANAALTNTQNVASLTASYQAAVTAGNTQLALQILAAIQKLGGATPSISPTTEFVSWFTQNWVGVGAVILGVAVLPNLIRKL